MSLFDSMHFDLEDEFNEILLCFGVLMPFKTFHFQSQNNNFHTVHMLRHSRLMNHETGFCFELSGNCKRLKLAFYVLIFQIYFLQPISNACEKLFWCKKAPGIGGFPIEHTLNQEAKKEVPAVHFTRTFWVARVRRSRSLFTHPNILR